jgi:hypothetical protein
MGYGLTIYDNGLYELLEQVRKAVDARAPYYKEEDSMSTTPLTTEGDKPLETPITADEILGETPHEPEREPAREESDILFEQRLRQEAREEQMLESEDD